MTLENPFIRIALRPEAEVDLSLEVERLLELHLPEELVREALLFALAQNDPVFVRRVVDVIQLYKLRKEGISAVAEMLMTVAEQLRSAHDMPLLNLAVHLYHRVHRLEGVSALHRGRSCIGLAILHFLIADLGEQPVDSLRQGYRIICEAEEFFNLPGRDLAEALQVKGSILSQLAEYGIDTVPNHRKAIRSCDRAVDLFDRYDDDTHNQAVGRQHAATARCRAAVVLPHPARLLRRATQLLIEAIALWGRESMKSGSMYTNLADIFILRADGGDNSQRNAMRAIRCAKRSRELIPRLMETRYLHGNALNAGALGRQIVAQHGQDSVRHLRIAIKQLQQAIMLAIPESLGQAKFRLNFAATILQLHRLMKCSSSLLSKAIKYCRRGLRLVPVGTPDYVKAHLLLLDLEAEAIDVPGETQRDRLNELLRDTTESHLQAAILFRLAQNERTHFVEHLSRKDDGLERALEYLSRAKRGCNLNSQLEHDIILPGRDSNLRPAG